ncbi:hypothetical protein I9Y31_000487 [Clostridium perfringens]|nr:hypothetical protein [Clostridium perfringens]
MDNYRVLRRMVFMMNREKIIKLRVGHKDNSNLDIIFKKDEEDINMKNMCKCKRCYGCEHSEELMEDVRNKFKVDEESIFELYGLRVCDIPREVEEMTDMFESMNSGIVITAEEEKTLFVQAKIHMTKEEIEEEQKRLQEVTGMKVCILKANFSYVGVE